MSDHKAEAQELFDSEFGSYPNQLGFETADAQHVINMLGALTQAALYLAEQQRIANLIAAAQWNDEALRRDGGRSPSGAVVDVLAERARVDAMFIEVKEALGLA